MSIAQSLLPEFDHEMASTRRVLQAVTDNILDWKAHPKSNTVRWVASHLVEIVGWVEGTLTQDSWDVNPSGGEPYRTPTFGSRQEILHAFDQNAPAARKAIQETTNSAFMQEWSLLSAGKPVFTMPRIAVIRGFVMNHVIHHRAILCVYLRLNDIPVPAMYGPTGDEAAS